MTINNLNNLDIVELYIKENSKESDIKINEILIEITDIDEEDIIPITGYDWE